VRPHQGAPRTRGDSVTTKGRSRTIPIHILVAAAVLVLGLAGGLGVAAASGSASPSPDATGHASPSANAGKVIYKVGILAEPDNLNPFIGYLWSSFEMWYLTYEPLVGYDYGTLTPVKGAKSTGLATDWSVTPDGKTWTFKIRSNAKWQDGVPLTAKDVAFTYNYIVNNDLTNWTSYTQDIKKAVAVDDTTVRIYCTQPKADMLRVYVPIVPEHIWSKIPGKAASVSYPNKPPYVGSGPFKCVEWKKNSYVKLVANPTYWRGRPKIDELYFDYYTNADTMVQDLKSGVIDGATGLLDAQYRQLKNLPGMEARTIHTNGFDELGFNCYTGTSRGNPVLKDWRFRQALNYAVDKNMICRLAYGGHAVPATTVITAGYYTDPDWHWEPPAGTKYTFDLGKAKQALDAAGYKDTNGDGIRDFKGQPITLRLWSRTDSMVSQSVGKLMAGWFKSIGLKITLQTMDDGVISDAMYAKVKGKLSPDYDMFLWGWYSDLDPGSILSYFTTAQIGSWSDCGYSNPTYDQLSDQQARTIDPAARKAIIDQMQQILYHDTPYIITAYSNDLEAFNTTKWQGYAASPAKIGNVLFPPYGNAGSQNFLLIEPKSGGDKAAGKSNSTLVIVIVAAVAALIVIALLVVRARRPRSVEE
jgi:peptide/nickel transport system substrate-binding protein